jgi:hypothetical protein
LCVCACWVGDSPIGGVGWGIIWITGELKWISGWIGGGGVKGFVGVIWDRDWFTRLVRFELVGVLERLLLVVGVFLNLNLDQYLDLSWERKGKKQGLLPLDQ